MSCYETRRLWLLFGGRWTEIMTSQGLPLSAEGPLPVDDQQCGSQSLHCFARSANCLFVNYPVCVHGPGSPTPPGQDAEHTAPCRPRQTFTTEATKYTNAWILPFEEPICDLFVRCFCCSCCYYYFCISGALDLNKLGYVHAAYTDGTQKACFTCLMFH